MLKHLAIIVKLCNTTLATGEANMHVCYILVRLFAGSVEKRVQRSTKIFTDHLLITAYHINVTHFTTASHHHP